MGNGFFNPIKEVEQKHSLFKDPCIARNVLPFEEWSELNNSTKEKLMNLTDSQIREELIYSTKTTKTK